MCRAIFPNSQRNMKKNLLYLLIMDVLKARVTPNYYYNYLCQAGFDHSSGWCISKPKSSFIFLKGPISFPFFMFIFHPGLQRTNFDD